MRAVRLLLCLQPFSLVASVMLTVGAVPNYPPPAPPLSVYAAQITIGTTALAPIGLSPKTTAPTKAALIYGVLIAAPTIPGFPYQNMTVTNPIPMGASSVTIGGLPPGTTVKFAPGKTGERPDKLTAPAGDPSGSIGFENNAFASVDATGGPSLFTAGIVTDAGDLSFTLSASSLPNLMGSTIVQMFFDDLNPVIPALGAQIVGFTPGDDVLNIEFDSTKTTMAGVIFGTSAQSDGVFGSLTVSEPVPEPGAAWFFSCALLASFLRRRMII